jgi:hypothetical protein
MVFLMEPPVKVFLSLLSFLDVIKKNKKLFRAVHAYVPIIRNQECKVLVR